MVNVSFHVRPDRSQQASIGRFWAVLIAASLTCSPVLASETYKVIYSVDGTTGTYPVNGLVRDMDGNYLGVMYKGHLDTTIYKITPDGAFSVLAQAAGPPGGGLSMDKDGAIYGTTTNFDDGEGTYVSSRVFKYEKSAGLQTLYAFGLEDNKGGTDPKGRLAIDAKGHVFGTVSQAYPSYGLVFKIVDGKEQIIHGFCGEDGVFPESSAIVLDSSNNLYGTTYYGGTFDKGVVFKIAPDKTYKVLHSFNGADGANPMYGVILDKDGNIYGNTSTGGTYKKGVIFKITPDGTTTTVYSFKGSTGINPRGALINDAAGNLYGTASGGLHDKGTVYKVTPGGQAFVLHSFGDVAGDGAYPSGRLVSDGGGYLYGVTAGGGTKDYGTIFRVPK